MPDSTTPDRPGPIARYEQGVLERIRDFQDPRQEWRRLFSEVLGTFFLVLVAVGGSMVNARFGGNAVPYGARVVAPGLMVAAIILFMAASFSDRNGCSAERSGRSAASCIGIAPRT